MRTMPRRPLNLKRYRRDDIVQHHERGGLFRVQRKRWRSECLDLLDLETGEEVIMHPKWLDPVTNPLILLAAQAA